MRKGLLIRLAGAVAVVALMLPGVASAALALGGVKGTDGTGRNFVDLVFTETAPTENEGLFAYDIAARIVRPGGVTGGVNLAGIERPGDNYVLDVPSGSTFSVAENTANNVLANVSSNNDLADITTGKKAARIFYTIAPDAAPGIYRLAFDPASTVFGSGDPNHSLEIAVALSDTDIVVPEPAGLALLGVASLLTLRRRRAA